MTPFELGSPDPRLGALLEDFPPGIFTERFYRSCELADRYTLALAADLARELDLEPCLSTWKTVAEVEQSLSLSPRFRMALQWLLERLAGSENLRAQGAAGARQYRGGGPLPRGRRSEIREMALANEPASGATFDLLDAASAAYPSVARGEARGEDALLGTEHIGLWLAYFHNDNPLYAVNNWVSASAAAARIPAGKGLRVLELGAGAGSGSAAFLQLLEEAGSGDTLERYCVTEPHPFFRRRAERSLKSRFRGLGLEFASLDIDSPWGPQGVEPSSFDVVYAVNVLHVAKRLPFSLAQARGALAPGGWLVAGECLRPFPGQPLWAEFIFQILESFTQVETDPDLRPNAGFLTPAQWKHAFVGAEFGPVDVVPDHEAISAFYPRFFTGAVCGRA